VILAAARTSGYQLLKLRILGAVPLSKDAVHVYIGMLCLLLALVALRVPLRSWRALLPGLAAALAMEALDLRDNAADGVAFRWAASAKDIVNTNLLPALLVTVARRRWIRT
jgi:hypothetical protein